MHESNASNQICGFNFMRCEFWTNETCQKCLLLLFFSSLFLLVSLSISIRLANIWWIKMPWIESEYQMFMSTLKRVEEWEIFKNYELCKNYIHLLYPYLECCVLFYGFIIIFLLQNWATSEWTFQHESSSLARTLNTFTAS